MNRIVTALLLSISGVLPLPAVSSPHSSHPVADDGIIRTAAVRLGHQRASTVLRWLRRQPTVASARLGLDHLTVDIRFRDGVPAVIVPATPHRTRLTSPLVRRPVHSWALPHASTGGRAIVLEPFVTDEVGADGGYRETVDLQAAGYTVDVKRDAEVTVRLLQTLSQYNVVYMETHSGVNQYGEGVVVSGQAVGVDDAWLEQLFNNKTYELAKAGVSGSNTIYWGILSRFVQLHMGQFPRNALLYMDACELLTSPLWWQALSGKGAGVLVTWDGNALFRDMTPNAATFFDALRAGQTVDGALKAVHAAGQGTSTDPNAATPKPAHLGYVGDGGITLENAASGGPTVKLSPTATSPPTASPPSTVTPGSTPLPIPTTAPPRTVIPTPIPTGTPTAMPTPSAIPLALTVDVHGTVAPGRRQVITVLSKPGARIHIQVRYPNGDTTYADRTVNATGIVSYAYRQSSSMRTHTRVWAHVLVTAADGLRSTTAGRAYRILPGPVDVSAEPRVAGPGARITLWIHSYSRTPISISVQAPKSRPTHFLVRTDSRGWARHGFRTSSASTSRGRGTVRALARHGGHLFLTTTTFTIR